MKCVCLLNMLCLLSCPARGSNIGGARTSDIEYLKAAWRSSVASVWPTATGPNLHAAVYGPRVYLHGGTLDVTGLWNWMGDVNNISRVNNVIVGDGSRPARPALPPTTQTDAAGWSALALNGGSLVTTTDKER